MNTKKRRGYINGPIQHLTTSQGTTQTSNGQNDQHMKFVLPTPPPSSSSLSEEQEDNKDDCHGPLPPPPTAPAPPAKQKMPPPGRPRNKNTSAPSTPPSRKKTAAISQEVSPDVLPYNGSSINEDEEVLVADLMMMTAMGWGGR
mmetsp:Transcript_23182/g.51546  ORF Transcript_23182/g.51546 Transcript_23182/m.51546 type:complete len:144 (+) Transcript_23182:1393-1824(+)